MKKAGIQGRKAAPDKPVSRTSPPRSNRLVTAAQIRDELAQALGKRIEAAELDEWEWQLRGVARWVNNYVKEPWDKTSVSEYRKADLNARKERLTLDSAADILRRDLESARATLASQSGLFAKKTRDYISQHEAALEALALPRWAFETGLPRTNANAKAVPKPWAVMARQIASEALTALQKFQKRPQTGFGGENGPIVKFTRAMLIRIMGNDKAPSRATILDAIKLLQQPDGHGVF